MPRVPLERFSCLLGAGKQKRQETRAIPSKLDFGLGLLYKSRKRDFFPTASLWPEPLSPWRLETASVRKSCPQP
ncbi:hypothetical protein MPNT_250012 [Candidatus Methylacidithermus pantelleriae]|uniref:Uncharacterized protein n=1 Tax=Candidatus Methylacidithermus pantelleriae TaxID=2744239 RepID=A0A8J2BJR7_9BACT|nr:hypothetical protein MPNT_250012 [Candidatus Methylacidithermus pantelleriae]